MLCVSAPACCGPLHVGCASAQSQKKIVGLARANVNQIFAMSDQKSESPSHRTVQTPKLEPFSRDKITRGVREPPLLRKAEKAIMDRCSTLEGEESFSCWETFFEFEKMKEESEELCDVSSSKDEISDCQPLEQMENLVRQSGGVKSLIGNVSMIAKMPKLQKEAQSKEQIPMPSSSSPVSDATSAKGHPFIEPDELPKSQEELEEEERKRMPDSPYTKMLRRFSAYLSGNERYFQLLMTHSEITGDYYAVLTLHIGYPNLIPIFYVLIRDSRTNKKILKSKVAQVNIDIRESLSLYEYGCKCRGFVWVLDFFMDLVTLLEHGNIDPVESGNHHPPLIKRQDSIDY